MNKRTKIICTVGPASAKESTLVKMIQAGMNVARLNFSHGAYADHKKLIAAVRRAAKKAKTTVAILQDLQGPRIRVGTLPPEGVMLKKGQKVILVPEHLFKKTSVSDVAVVPIQYEQLYKDVKKKIDILIEDGKIRLEVVQVKNGFIYCVVKVAGIVKTHKGINVPGVTLQASVITKKDLQDIAFGVKNGVDYIALSFVKDATDIRRLKKIIASHQKRGETRVRVIAKIERQEAVLNYDSILEEVDGIMVARGDLGLEVAAQDVPILQKNMILKCLQFSKPVIVATQMLDSMVVNLQPTRAEVSDVANAVIDHTDAVMLSAESAVGKYPVQTVQLMAHICIQAEESVYDDLSCATFSVQTIADSFRQSLCQIAAHHQIQAICLYDDTGIQAQKIAKYRPELVVVVLTTDVRIQQQLVLVGGVLPLLVKELASELSPKTIAFIKKSAGLSLKTGMLFLGAMDSKNEIDLMRFYSL